MSKQKKEKNLETPGINFIPKNKTVKIQNFEDYLKEIGISDTSLLATPSEYKELFSQGDYKKDDIMSITPGLYSPPSSRLYASLLSLYLEQQRKKLNEEMTNKKTISKDFIDLFLKDIKENNKK